MPTIIYSPEPELTAEGLTRAYGGERWRADYEIRWSDPLDWRWSQARWLFDDGYRSAVTSVLAMMGAPP